MLQLNLDFLMDPPPEMRVWNNLNDDQRAALIAALTRLIAKAANATATQIGENES